MLDQVRSFKIKHLGKVKGIAAAYDKHRTQVSPTIKVHNGYKIRLLHAASEKPPVKHTDDLWERSKRGAGVHDVCRR